MSPEIDALVPADAVVDPERPVDPEELGERIRAAAMRASRWWAACGVSRSALLALGGARRRMALDAACASSVALEALVRIARALHDSPVAPLAVLAAYVVGGLLVVPVTVLIVATGIVFGPLLGAHICTSSARCVERSRYVLARTAARRATP